MDDSIFHSSAKICAVQICIFLLSYPLWKMHFKLQICCRLFEIIKHTGDYKPGSLFYTVRLHRSAAERLQALHNKSTAARFAFLAPVYRLLFLSAEIDETALTTLCLIVYQTGNFHSSCTHAERCWLSDSALLWSFLNHSLIFSCPTERSATFTRQLERRPRTCSSLNCIFTNARHQDTSTKKIHRSSFNQIIQTNK